MSVFTPLELLFLKRHGFAEDDVYDGRFETKSERQASARKTGSVLVLTDVRCRAADHRIRTRAGHCAQCNPANIAFTSRETITAYVYIAGSLAGKAIKIGEAGDLAQRLQQLQAERYGGYSDWSLLYNVEVKNAGRVEREVSSRILGEKIYKLYTKDRRARVAFEMFKCSFSSALQALSDVVGEIEQRQTWLERNRDYEFSK